MTKIDPAWLVSAFLVGVIVGPAIQRAMQALLHWLFWKRADIEDYFSERTRDKLP